MKKKKKTFNFISKPEQNVVVELSKIRSMNAIKYNKVE